MKHIKLFESYKDDISYIKAMVSDIEDDYGWRATVSYSVLNSNDVFTDYSLDELDELDSDGRKRDRNITTKLIIKYTGHPGTADVVDLSVVMDKTKQVLSQLSKYEIDSVSLYLFSNPGEVFNKDSFKGKGGWYTSTWTEPGSPSAEKPWSASILLMKNVYSDTARLQGYTASDKLKNIDKYYNCPLNYYKIIFNLKKVENKSVLKKFFNYFKN